MSTLLSSLGRNFDVQLSHRQVFPPDGTRTVDMQLAGIVLLFVFLTVWLYVPLQLAAESPLFDRRRLCCGLASLYFCFTSNRSIAQYSRALLPETVSILVCLFVLNFFSHNSLSRFTLPLHAALTTPPDQIQPGVSDLPSGDLCLCQLPGEQLPSDVSARRFGAADETGVSPTGALNDASSSEQSPTRGHEPTHPLIGRIHRSALSRCHFRRVPPRRQAARLRADRDQDPLLVPISPDLQTDRVLHNRSFSRRLTESPMSLPRQASDEPVVRVRNLRDSGNTSPPAYMGLFLANREVDYRDSLAARLGQTAGLGARLCQELGFPANSTTHHIPHTAELVSAGPGPPTGLELTALRLALGNTWPEPQPQTQPKPKPKLDGKAEFESEFESESEAGFIIANEQAGQAVDVFQSVPGHMRPVEAGEAETSRRQRPRQQRRRRPPPSAAEESGSSLSSLARAGLEPDALQSGSFSAASTASFTAAAATGRGSTVSMGLIGTPARLPSLLHVSVSFPKGPAGQVDQSADGGEDEATRREEQRRRRRDEARERRERHHEERQRARTGITNLSIPILMREGVCMRLAEAEAERMPQRPSASAGLTEPDAGSSTDLVVQFRVDWIQVIWPSRPS
ncbi:unnamed protein product [Protopolystoma xenopodis]|uniref:Transmembrane protein n=1 Tax=Protopolystoma xenopodis TaxID=117903 RepID=A0A448XBI4_9PLAT|nr:unnamed protein product [Protopolystoma xenopodis]